MHSSSRSPGRWVETSGKIVRKKNMYSEVGSRKVATVTKQFFLLITTHRRLEKQKNLGSDFWFHEINSLSAGNIAQKMTKTLAGALLRVVQLCITLAKCAKNREHFCNKNSGFQFFASLSSSHDFLSVIFGILRKFRIGIGLRNFCGRKNFRRKNMINNFDRKNFGRENFWSKIFEILKISKIQIFENFGISKFSKSQKFSTKKISTKNFRSKFLIIFFFDEKFSDHKNFVNLFRS